MRRWGIALALLLSVGVNLGLVAAIAARRLSPRPGPGAEARPPGFPPRPGAGLILAGDPVARLARLSDFLELEGEERRRFIDLQLSFYQQTLKLRTEMGEVNRELRRELASRTPDRPRVDALLERSSRIHLSLERALAENVLASRELLDERQERKYLRLISRLRPAGPLGLFSDRPPRPQPRRPFGPRQ